MGRSNGTESWTYSYDAFGALTEVTTGTGDVIECRTDGRGRRVQRLTGAVPPATPTPKTVSSTWVWRDQLRIAAELDSAGTLTKRFVSALGRNVPDVAMFGSDTHRLITDHLGSVRLVVKVDDGAVAHRWDYDVWGVATFNVVASLQTEGFQPFGYAGGVFDRRTGLV
ncbi:MAG: hypothetical protein KC731_26965, partial [Myxococcales bacterium]|nr:hypothetical protein [Myxococcales bacterium]